MSKREVGDYLVGLEPKPIFKPSVRQRSEPATETARAAGEKKPPREVAERLGAPPVEEEGVRGAETELPASAPGLIEPARPAVYNFRFAATKDFKEKFERLAEVLGVAQPVTNIAEILERAVDLALEKKDPRRKHERRLGHERKRSSAVTARESRPAEIPREHEAPRSRAKPAISRHVPAEVRERVLERASYQCEYRGPDGTRCSSRTRLEIEHERPFAIFKSYDERFLRAFCAGHNRLSAERVYGAEFIREKIGLRHGQRNSRVVPQAVGET